MEPTSLAEKFLFLQVLLYGFILWSTICHEAFDAGILEDFLFLKHVVSGTLIIEHHHQFLLQREGCLHILYGISHRILWSLSASNQQASRIIIALWNIEATYLVLTASHLGWSVKEQLDIPSILARCLILTVNQLGTIWKIACINTHLFQYGRCIDTAIDYYLNNTSH